VLGSLRQMSTKLDGVAMALSGACLVHCLVLPIVAASLPIFTGAAHAEWIHWIFVAIAAPTSFMALMHDRHSKSLILILRAVAIGGLGLLMFGALGWPNHDTGSALTISGGVVLAVVHLVNYFGSQQSNVCAPRKAP
jgi:MerC mercury resistance protein